MLSYRLEKKETFVDDKNVNFWKSKKWVFAKGISPLFQTKNPEFFQVCFLAN